MTPYTPHTNKRYRMATFHDVISANEAIGRINIDLTRCESCLAEAQGVIAELVRAGNNLSEMTGWYQDTGPVGHGWQSPELVKAFGTWKEVQAKATALVEKP